MADSNRRPLACQARAERLFRTRRPASKFDVRPLRVVLVRCLSQLLSAFLSTTRRRNTHAMDLQLHSELVPMPHNRLLPGPVGLLRMDGFAANAAETTALRAPFESFEGAAQRNPSSRASVAPRQKCGPWLNVRCRLSSRPRSSVSGSAN